MRDLKESLLVIEGKRRHRKTDLRLDRKPIEGFGRGETGANNCADESASGLSPEEREILWSSSLEDETVA